MPPNEEKQSLIPNPPGPRYLKETLQNWRARHSASLSGEYRRPRVLVGNILLGFWGTSELHDVTLTICDQNNQQVSIGGGGGSWIWKHGTGIDEKLASAYTQLRPRTIFGVKEDIPVTLRPGRYRLTASYREIEALTWTEADRRALPIQVWTEPLTSNTVTITVTP